MAKRFSKLDLNFLDEKDEEEAKGGVGGGSVGDEDLEVQHQSLKKSSWMDLDLFRHQGKYRYFP